MIPRLVGLFGVLALAVIVAGWGFRRGEPLPAIVHQQVSGGRVAFQQTQPITRAAEAIPGRITVIEPAPDGRHSAVLMANSQQVLIVPGTDWDAPVLDIEDRDIDRFRRLSWRPDSTEVAVLGETWRGIDLIFRMYTSGTRDMVYRLPDEGMRLQDLVWTPDGARMTVISDGVGIVSLAPDGDDERILWATEDTLDHLAWSPDGSRLAFVGFDGAELCLNVLTPRSGAVARVWCGFGELGFIKPGWSADGARLLFTMSDQRGESPGLRWVNADGTHPARLTASRYVERNPLWSPDGSTVLFERGGALMLLDPARRVSTRIHPNGGNGAWLVSP